MGRAAARRRRSRPGSPTRRSAPTRPARSGSPPPAAASSGTSRPTGSCRSTAAGRSRRATTRRGRWPTTSTGCERMLGVLAPAFEPVALESLEELEVGVAWTELADPLVAGACRGGGRPLPAPPSHRAAAVDNASYARLHARGRGRPPGALRRERRCSTARTCGSRSRRCLAVRDSEVERAERLRAEYREQMEPRHSTGSTSC